MRSDDNGDNWSDPLELTAPPYISEDFVPYVESVWPAIPRHIPGDNLWVLYQQDGTPGTERWGANHSPGESSINWFEVPMRGSLALLFAMSVVYLMSTLGLGLFISTISHTQQQAMMTATFFFLTPMIYLSGFIFPIENMPAWIQPLTYLIPLRYFLVIVRGIFLKGLGLEVLWPQALALLTWGLVVLALSVIRSSKRLA